MTYEIDESQRQAIILAIAQLAVERPGWDWMLSVIAETIFNGKQMYLTFKEQRRVEKACIAARS